MKTYALQGDEIRVFDPGEGPPLAATIVRVDGAPACFVERIPAATLSRTEIDKPRTAEAALRHLGRLYRVARWQQLSGDAWALDLATR